MNDPRLSRLLAAARAAAPAEPMERMSAPLQTRILARWRACPARSWSPALVLRGGLALASVLMIACIAWSMETAGDDVPGEVVLANYELRADLMP